MRVKYLGLSDGTNVNHTLVKDGWCCWYRNYAPGDTVLEGLEKQGREGRTGLWADPQPMPQDEYRQSFLSFWICQDREPVQCLVATECLPSVTLQNMRKVLQDAEKIRQLRSRILQTLNVPQRVHLGSSLAAALLVGLFEPPAGVFSCCAR